MCSVSLVVITLHECKHFCKVDAPLDKDIWHDSIFHSSGAVHFPIPHSQPWKFSKPKANYISYCWWCWWRERWIRRRGIANVVQNTIQNMASNSYWCLFWLNCWKTQFILAWCNFFLIWRYDFQFFYFSSFQSFKINIWSSEFTSSSHSNCLI